MTGPRTDCWPCTTAPAAVAGSGIGERHAAQFWHREWEAMERSNRIHEDEVRQLRQELEEVEKHAHLAVMGAYRCRLERDQARRVAAGLLRLTRAWWHGDDDDNEVYAALPASVRKLVEE